MKIVIEINEVRPGHLRTTISGVGITSPLEGQMIDHVAACLDTAFKSFPQIAGGTVGGRMKTKSFNVPKG
jgi:hypothetical protein